MTALKPGTTMGRIAALEARYAELAARLDRFEREVLDPAWPKDPPPRDPASTVAATTAIRSTPRQAPATATAHGFGFSPPISRKDAP